MAEDLPTPSIVIDAEIVRRNLARMADYARSHNLGLRPHTKTHKSTRLAKMQLEHGAVGLTVAKVGEARVMAQVGSDLLMAYPPVHPGRCAELAELARTATVRVAVDSTIAADGLAAAARSAGSVIGALVDLDVGHHRTGVQSAADALALAQHIDSTPGLRLDGLMFYPGHVARGRTDEGAASLRSVNDRVNETLDLWERHGLKAAIVSGGSTPTAGQSHAIERLTEFRPGTYIFNDVNSVRCGWAAWEDCAARILTTVVSTAVPGQIVLDAGSKTLSSDRCGLAPDSGHGYLPSLPQAKVTKLSEEHAQVDVTACETVPRVGDRVWVIPNHICPCINLLDRVWWKEPDQSPTAIPVEGRGQVF